MTVTYSGLLREKGIEGAKRFLKEMDIVRREIFDIHQEDVKRAASRCDLEKGYWRIHRRSYCYKCELLDELANSLGELTLIIQKEEYRREGLREILHRFFSS